MYIPGLSALKVPSDGSREIAHFFSTVSCLSSLVSSQLAVPCYTFFGDERVEVGEARDYVRNGGRIVGVVYAMTNQIAHYHVVEN